MSRVWVVIKRFGRVIGFLCGIVVLAICAFMLWRVFSTGTPKTIDTLSRNDRLASVYAEKGDEMVAFKQNQDIITRAEYNSGYFAIPEYAFFPESNQLQLVFRYNNSTLKALATDKSLSEIPDRSGDYFDVSLVLYVDLTPENLEDNDRTDSPNVKKIRCKGHINAKDKTTLYNFYRYTFYFDESDEPVDISSLMADGTLIAVHAQFYYNEELDYNASPYGALLLYNPADKNLDVKLSSADKKALS